MSQLVRMPDQFTPGRGARAAATPTCSSCCCCCCCVVTLVTSAIVLPTGAARAIDRANTPDPAAPPSYGQPPPPSPQYGPSPHGAGPPQQRTPGARALGYVALTIAPGVTLGLLIGVSVLLESVVAGGVVAALAGLGLAFGGDKLTGHPRPGLSVAKLIGFAALFVLELIVSVALLSAADGWLYLILALLGTVVAVTVYLMAGRRR